MSCPHLITGFSLVWAVVLLCFWIEPVSIKFPTSRVQPLWRHVSREQSPVPGTVCVCEHAQSHAVGPTQKIAVNLGANPPRMEYEGYLYYCCTFNAGGASWRGSVFAPLAANFDGCKRANINQHSCGYANQRGAIGRSLQCHRIPFWFPNNIHNLPMRLDKFFALGKKIK
ncbi:hypothetical protein HDV62DRAFT_384617 [Trichoderma sp. SZMC 28011]